jgi:hypothetical protein
MQSEAVQSGVKRTEADLKSKFWYEKYGSLLNYQEMDLGFRILISNESSAVLLTSNSLAQAFLLSGKFKNSWSG